MYELNLETIIKNQSKYEFKFDGKSMAEILVDLEENRDDNVDLEEDVETEFMETTACEELKDLRRIMKSGKRKALKDWPA